MSPICAPSSVEIYPVTPLWHGNNVTFGDDYSQSRAGNSLTDLSTLHDVANDTFHTVGHVNLAYVRRHYIHYAERIPASIECD